MTNSTVNIDQSKTRGRLWRIGNLYARGWVYLKFVSGADASGNYLKLFLFFFTKPGLLFFKKFFKKGLSLLFNIKFKSKAEKLADKNSQGVYSISKSEEERYGKEIEKLKQQPRLSIIILAAIFKEKNAKETKASLSNQVYKHFEILNATTSMEEPSGEYCIFIEEGGVFAVNALFEIAKHLNDFPQTDILYTNEEEEYRHSLIPNFKPYWSPDTLLSLNYFGDLTVVRKTMLCKNDVFQPLLDEPQKYRMLLSAYEKNAAVYHLPKVLVKRKTPQTSFDADVYHEILSESLTRKGDEANIVFHLGKKRLVHQINYKIKENKKVSIIIPTKDSLALIKQCVSSIFELTTYSNFEVIVIDNNSTEQEFLDYMIYCERRYQGRFFCHPFKHSFNFSAINNFGVTKSSGDYIVLLNNDTKIITPDWLEQMVSHAQRKSIGVVGALLLYPDGSIQHAGIDFDIKGLPFHPYAGEEKKENDYVANFPALTAACVMVRKEVYLQVDGLDETLAVEFNDVDFCLKVREAGYQNVYTPYAELYHYESFSRGSSYGNAEKYGRHLKEKDIFMSKWLGTIQKIYRPYPSA